MVARSAKGGSKGQELAFGAQALLQRSQRHAGLDAQREIAGIVCLDLIEGTGFQHHVRRPWQAAQRKLGAAAAGHDGHAQLRAGGQHRRHLGGARGSNDDRGDQAVDRACLQIGGLNRLGRDDVTQRVRDCFGRWRGAPARGVTCHHPQYEGGAAAGQPGPTQVIVARTRSALREARVALVGTVGLVPTLGALHDGHAALLRTARAQCDAVVATLFVNPRQFDSAADLAAYPRNEAADLDVFEAAGVDVAYLPATEEMYPDGFTASVHVGPLGEVLEGADRPGHSTAWRPS